MEQYNLHGVQEHIEQVIKTYLLHLEIEEQ